MRRGQVLLAADPHAKSNPLRQVRFVLPCLLSGEEVDLDALAAGDYPFNFVQERPAGAVPRETSEDVAFDQFDVDTARAWALERLGHLFVEGAVGRHTAAPRTG